MCFSVRSALGVRINWRLIVGVSVRASSATTEVVWAACSVSSTRRAGVTRARAARATLSSKIFATELVGCGLSSGFGIPNPTPSPTHALPWTSPPRPALPRRRTRREPHHPLTRTLPSQDQVAPARPPERPRAVAPATPLQRQAVDTAPPLCAQQTASAETGSCPYRNTQAVRWPASPPSERHGQGDSGPPQTLTPPPYASAYPHTTG